MNLFRSKKPFVLVIGSAHLDVLGDFSIKEKRRVDKEGEVYCSVGGTAFNIAVDIANEGGVTVSLFTHVRERSPITDLIVSRLHDEGVSTQYVFRDAKIQKDSGFVAHRADGELLSAVSSMPVEDAQFDEPILASAINRASVVIAECNLSGTQLALIVRLCKATTKPLVVSGVSESKCQRIKLLEDPAFSIAYFVLNIKEAKALLGRQPAPENSSDAIDLCRLANANRVVVTNGSDGWMVFSIDRTPFMKFGAPNVPSVRSTSGAGDALIAGIAHYLATNRVFDWTELQVHIHRFVADILRKRVASGADLTSLETLGAAHMRSLLGNLKRPGIQLGAVVGVIFAGLGLIAGLIQAAVSLETSTNIRPLLTGLFCSVSSNSSICIPKQSETTRK